MPLDWLLPPRHAVSVLPGVVVVVPGLSSDIQSPYIVTFARACLRRGLAVCVIGTRGVAVPLTRPKMSCGSYTDDIRYAIRTHFTHSEVRRQLLVIRSAADEGVKGGGTCDLPNQHPVEDPAIPRAVLVGFSLGGNLVVKLLGEEGPAAVAAPDGGACLSVASERTCIVAVVSVCSPWDFHASRRNMDKLVSHALYQPALMSGIQKLMAKSEPHFGDAPLSSGFGADVLVIDGVVEATSPSVGGGGPLPVSDGTPCHRAINRSTPATPRTQPHDARHVQRSAVTAPAWCHPRGGDASGKEQPSAFRSLWQRGSLVRDDARPVPQPHHVLLQSDVAEADSKRGGWGASLPKHRIHFRRARSCRSVADFDSVATAPHHHYDSVEQYYTCASCFPYYLRRVSIPLLCVTSLDDPITGPPPPMERWHRDVLSCNPNVTLVVKPVGGHLGYLGSPLAEAQARDNVMEELVTDAILWQVTVSRRGPL